MFGFGIYFFKTDENEEYSGYDFNNLYNSIQTKNATIDEMFVYGKTLNMTISIDGILKDNFENAKLYMIDRKWK